MPEELEIRCKSNCWLKAEYILKNKQAKSSFFIIVEWENVDNHTEYAPLVYLSIRPKKRFETALLGFHR